MPDQSASLDTTRAGTNTALYKFRVWEDLATLSLMLMDLLLVVIWVNTLFFPTMIWPRCAFSLALPLFTAYLAGRVLPTADYRPKFRLTLSAVLIALSVWLALNLLLPQLWTLNPIRWMAGLISQVRHDDSLSFSASLLVLVALAFRGAALSRRPAARHDLISHLSFGLIIILIFGYIFLQNDLPAALVILSLFLFAALFGINAARVNNLAFLFGGKVPALTPNRLATTLLALMGLLLLANATGWITQAFLAQLLLKLVTYALYAVLFVSMVILSPIFFLVMALFQYLLSNQVFKLPEQEDQEMMKMLKELQEGTLYSDRWLNDLMYYGRIFLMVLGVAILIFSTIAILRRRRENRRITGEDEHEHAASLKRANLIDALLDRLPKFINLRGMVMTARIRRVYGKLINICARMGHTRPAAQTPNEFLPAMEALFPDHPTELTKITDAYNRIRYGELPESEEEVTQVEAALMRIEAEARMRLKTLRLQKKKTAAAGSAEHTQPG